MLYTAAFFSVTAICFTIAPAKADCGMHQFETVTVPRLKQLEAIPTIPRNVVHTSMFNPPLMSLDIAVAIPLPCSDESETRNDIAFNLTRFWERGLLIRATVAAYQTVTAGLTDEPPVCYKSMRAVTRSILVRNLAAGANMGSFDSAVGKPGTKAKLKTYRQTPYYSHIASLWHDSYKAVGLQFPGFEYGWYGYTGGIKGEGTRIVEHLPAGVHCADNPMYTSLKKIPSPEQTSSNSASQAVGNTNSQMTRVPNSINSDQTRPDRPIAVAPFSISPTNSWNDTVSGNLLIHVAIEVQGGESDASLRASDITLTMALANGGKKTYVGMTSPAPTFQKLNPLGNAPTTAYQVDPKEDLGRLGSLIVPAHGTVKVVATFLVGNDVVANPSNNRNVSLK